MDEGVHSWCPTRKVKNKDWQSFMDAYVRLDSHFEYLHQRDAESPLTVELIRTQAVEISVVLHIFFTDRYPLIRKCIHKPKFYPLKKIKKVDPEPIKMSISLTQGGPPIGKCYYKLFDLVGFKRISNGNRRSMTTEIFDFESSCLLKIDEWESQEVLRIEDMNRSDGYSLRDMIKIVRNSEGAHSGGRPNLKGDKLLFFGSRESITYAHWIVLCLGRYVLFQIKRGMIDFQEEWKTEMGSVWSPVKFFTRRFELRGTSDELPILFEVKKDQVSTLLVCPGKDTLNGTL